jgi:enamine deaminase RidA (YjgF/YER057c/UK114 family)
MVLDVRDLNVDVAAKSFVGPSGVTEHYVTITAPPHLDLAQQLDAVTAHYQQWTKANNLAPETAIFRRLFLSDAINQIEVIEACPLAATSPDNPVAISIVQQPPLPAAKIALLAYHMSGPQPLKKTALSAKHMIVERGGLKHLWSTRLCCGSRAAISPVEVQTSDVFNDLLGVLKRTGGTLADNCVRTWIYMKDVDVFYRGMVNSRRTLFTHHGLTEDTHYIASTGIKGCCEHQFDLLLMDAYSIIGMLPKQMTYLNDFDYLCATHDYNVTFERGTRIAYADRAHHYISGTASIDKLGNTIHLGDVMAQLDLALVNVDVLLKSGDACLDDMMYLIVYLRDAGDRARVQSALADRLPNLPVVIVEGAVCRPEWLIEIEGVAIASHNDQTLPPY